MSELVQGPKDIQAVWPNREDEYSSEITRLRAEVCLFEMVVCETAKALGVVPDNDAIIEAIERLRAENEKLRAALKPFADDAKYCQNLYKLLDDNMWNVPVKWLNAAAAAIRESGDE